MGMGAGRLQVIRTWVLGPSLVFEMILVLILQIGETKVLALGAQPARGR
jgi:hypothetical protein